MQQLMQGPHRSSASARKCVMLTQQHFDGSNPRVAKNHWAAFEYMLQIK